VRQLLNVAYATRAAGLDEQELRTLDEQIGMAEDPEELAKEALRAHQEAQGMTFSDEPDPESALNEEAGIEIEYG
jgi:hypothetical protein